MSRKNVSKNIAIDMFKTIESFQNNIAYSFSFVFLLLNEEFNSFFTLAVPFWGYSIDFKIGFKKCSSKKSLLK